MSDFLGNRLPCGFAGPVSSKRDLVPTGGEVVRLPDQGVKEGAVLRLPDGPFDAVVLDSLTESMGQLRPFLQSVAERILPGGEVLVDAENLQAPHALRRTLEGRPGAVDPWGSVREPERGVLPMQIFESLDAAGVVVLDCYAVPSRSDSAGDDFAATLLTEGFLAPTYIGGLPPARLWIRGRKMEASAGSVLIGAGSDADRECTRRAVEAFLPPDWEVVLCPGESERASLNRGVALSHGDLLWFLRAGSVPEAELFEGLATIAVTAPAIPQALLDRGEPVCGLMAPRLLVLLAGPLPLRWDCDQIAYEDYGMRLEALARGPTAVSGGITCPTSSDPDVATLSEEADELMGLWEGVVSEDNVSVPVPHSGKHSDPPWKGREPRVSLCMIARNEERFLADCLRRAAPAVDEIIVVDTNSTDSTVEIAKSFGATVLNDPWADDFAKPRNVGLEAATGDWILVLDADEMLDDGSAEEILRLVRDPSVSGYHIVMRNTYSNGRTLGVRMVRLFRKLEGVRFCNRIHEQVTPSLAMAAAREGLVLSVSDLELDHLGYSDEVMESRNKNDRNERLFRLQLAEHPDDIYMLYKFGDFLRRRPGRARESIAALESALEKVFELTPHDQQALPYASEIAALCALENAREEREDVANDIVERALRCFIPTPNLHYIAAGLAVRDGRNDDAICHYQRCMSYTDQVLVVPIQEGVTSWVSMTGMAQALLQKGDREKARRLLERSYEIKPSHDVTALTMSRMHFEGGDFSTALKVLMDHLAEYPDSAGACQQATIILAKLGMTDQARTMGERAVQLLDSQCLEVEARRMRETLAGLCGARPDPTTFESTDLGSRDRS